MTYALEASTSTDLNWRVPRLACATVFCALPGKLAVAPNLSSERDRGTSRRRGLVGLALWALWAAFVAWVALPGGILWATEPKKLPPSMVLEPPHELSMVSQPAYRIAPPDVVQILVIKLVPRQPYHIELFDLLQIRAVGTMLEQPIDQFYLVQADGTVALGPVYGKVRVVGMSMEEASRAIMHQLQSVLQHPVVTVVLARSSAAQQIARNFVVQPDGTVDLGLYGMVPIAGKTITEARLAVEKQLSLYFDGPEVGLDVVSYRSQKYYIIIAGAEGAEPIVPVPVTGNETVLDALSQIRGLPQISSKTMWVARPAPGGFGCEQILPIDWVAITRGARTDTNYQILPGDRIYIVDDKIIAANHYLTMATEPIQRLLSVSGLGAATIRNFQTTGRGYNQNR